jgi:hypothetical protein
MASINSNSVDPPVKIVSLSNLSVPLVNENDLLFSYGENVIPMGLPLYPT